MQLSQRRRVLRFVITSKTLLFVLVGGLASCLHAQVSTGGEAFESQRAAVSKLLNASPIDWNAAELGVRGLIKNFPLKEDGYMDMMTLIGSASFQGNHEREHALAQELANSSGPVLATSWSKNVVSRLDSIGKPIEIQFTAVDGRRVSLSAMKGKVVMVDFWATWCPPCVAGFPMIKAAFDRYHDKGLEIIGISCDLDQSKLLKFISNRSVTWPQYFDGKGQMDNKWCQAFGLYGLPYMMLIDKSGRLQYADFIADNAEFEERIEKLLAE